MTCEVAVFGFTLKPIPYTYTIPKGLNPSPGQLVEFPFGKRAAKGIVTSVSESDSSIFDLKPITRTLSDSPILTSKQVDLARWISENYFISLAESFELFLPRIPKDGVEIGTNPQELILFPTVNQLRSAQSSYPGNFYSPSLPAKQFDKAWAGIRSGKIEVVYGTRSAIFAPFCKLKKITIFQTESDLYKDQRRPYYRTLAVAQELAKVHGATLKAVSYSPRVQDHYVVTHEIKKTPESYAHQITDLKKTPIISSDLLKTLKTVDPGKTLIFLNRRSEKGPLTCSTCKQISYTDDPSICPNCGSSDIKFKVFNLSTLSKKITESVNGNFTFSTQQIFFDAKPSTRYDSIIVLSADTYLGHNSFDAQEKTFQLITNLMRLLAPKGNIIIQSAFPNLPAIRAALKNDYQAFYDAELESRREANFPPFSKLAKIIHQDSKNNPEKPRLPQDVELFGPFQSGQPYFVARGTSLKALESLTRPWKLDIDPLSV